MANDNDGNEGPKKPKKAAGAAPPQQTRPEGYKVGPGYPPFETRWQAGCPSPNPKGRPPKARLLSMLAVVDPFAAPVRDHGRVKVALRNGTEISRAEANLEALFKQGVQGNVRASALYHKIIETAAAEERKIIEESIRRAIQHQEAWLGKFLECERLGWRLPDVYPDPRDIIITLDGVRYTGPVTLADKLKDDELLCQRRNIIEILLEEKDLPFSRLRTAKLEKTYGICDALLSEKHQKSLSAMMKIVQREQEKEDRIEEDDTS